MTKSYDDQRGYVAGLFRIMAGREVDPADLDVLYGILTDEFLAGEVTTVSLTRLLQERVWSPPQGTPKSGSEAASRLLCTITPFAESSSLFGGKGGRHADGSGS